MILGTYVFETIFIASVLPQLEIKICLCLGSILGSLCQKSLCKITVLQTSISWFVICFTARTLKYSPRQSIDRAYVTNINLSFFSFLDMWLKVQRGAYLNKISRL